jgi:hypothetical protein
MIIGHANIFQQLDYSTSAPISLPETYDITPQGDPPGLYWGCVLPRFSGRDDDTPQGKSIEIAVLVDGTVRWWTRFINRQLFRPYQAFQNWNVPRPSADMNLVWDTRTKTTVSSPSGTLFGTIADGSWTDKPTAAPKQSYMNAYFLPATPGPQTAALPFTVGTTPVSSLESYGIHAEPIHFWIDRPPGATVLVRARVYREQPLSSLSAPINDDLPTDKLGPEPDEVLESQSVYVTAWMVRVGRAGVTTETPETYERDTTPVPD